MHILIIEAVLTGHHSGYLTHISAAYLDAGHDVTVTVLQRESAHPAIMRLKMLYGHKFNVHVLQNTKYKNATQSRFGQPGQELLIRQMFGKAYREVSQIRFIDYIFLPYMDYCLYAFGLLGTPFGKTQWGGICMHPSFHYKYYDVIAPVPKHAFIKRILFVKLLGIKTIKVIYSIDELLQTFIAENYSKLKLRLQYLADPAELNGTHTYKTSRQKLGISDDAIVILVYGVINDRKGLDLLVDAMTSDIVPKNLHLLIVGKQSKSIQSLISTPQFTELKESKRCHIIDEFVNESIEQIVFTACDTVWLGYKNYFTMSGVLILAVLAGKNIIATKNGLIGWYVKNKKIGNCININEKLEIESALINTVSRPASEISSFQSIILNSHSWGSFVKTLVIS